jgi:hypothetical protein
MLTKNTDLLKSEIARHIAADAVIQGEYWGTEDNAVGGKGCFIGCLAHSNDASVLGEKYGLPLMLVKVCENIFEGLPADDAKDFFAQIGDAVGSDGKDLTRVVWAFLADELRQMPENAARDVGDVLSGMDILAAGGEWPDAAAVRARADAAARAADPAYAARAADPAYAAAYDFAARAAAYAARAADPAYAAAYDFAARAAAYAARDAAAHAARDAAARQSQKNRILKLIREAA